MMMQIFIWYWHANELSEQSFKIKTAIYSSDFFDFTVPMKKKMILIMMRTQKPLEVSIGHWKAMNLETFQALINNAYSFFNIARTFNK